MKRHNANGGQRRSKAVCLHIPQAGFSVLMVEIVKAADTQGKDAAMHLLERAQEKWDLGDEEVSFIKSLIEKK